MTKLTPHHYQETGIAYVKAKPFAGLFLDPGLGKTAIILSAISDLQFMEPTKTLVIAPLRVAQTVWGGEVEKWDNFRHLSYTLLHGPGKDQRVFDPDKDLYLINAENIFWLVELMLQKGGPRFDWLVVDESSKFKAPSAQRFKCLKKVIPMFKRRYILTGTPAPNTLIDLWSQMFILDRGLSLGQGVTKYRQQYFNRVSFGNFDKYQLRPGAEEAIYSAIAPKVLRMDAKDCLSLPPVVYNTITVNLPSAARKQYESFEKNLFAELANGESKFVASVSAAYNVCRQVANGFVYIPRQPGDFDPKRIEERTEILHKKKIEALLDLIGELQGKPVLVAYHYKQDLKSLKKALGDNTPCIGSGVLGSETSSIIRKWNKGEIPVLLGHPQSMSHGLNLQAGGNDVAWYSLTDSLENYLQLNRRVLRQGVKGQVRIHHIVADKTVDVAIMQRLASKERTQQALLDAIKEYRRTKQ